jgi:hypothetical protein
MLRLQINRQMWIIVQIASPQPAHFLISLLLPKIKARMSRMYTIDVQFSSMMLLLVRLGLKNSEWNFTNFAQQKEGRYNL